MSKQIPNKSLLRSVSKNHFLLGMVSTSVILITFSVFNLFYYFFPEESNVLGVKIEVDTKTNLINQKSFWISFLQENPRYIHGWIKLASIEVQLENPSGARIALDNALAVNPNSPLIKKAEQDLGLLRF